MSTANTRVNTSNMLVTDYDTSKVFLSCRETQKGLVTLASGTNILVGTVMGRISATGILVPLESDAVDGSQFPVGILMNEITVPATSARATILTAGEVDKGKIIFYNGTDDFDTVVDGRQLLDRIGADTVGVVLIESTELTKFDN